MKCIVIDDEPLARQGMELLINQVSNLELSAKFSNVIEADNFLNSNVVDIIFLDIQMPGISGLDYLKISKTLPLVVITTAYPEFALEGFDLDVIDYITKPIRIERFKRAVSKCEKLIESEGLGMKDDKSHRDDHLFIRSNRKYVRVNIKDINRIEAMKDYVMIFQLNEKIPVSINLKAIETRLPADKFIRVNKSTIINSDYVKSIDNDLIDLGVSEITLGDKYKEDTLKVLFKGRLIKRDY